MNDDPMVVIHQAIAAKAQGDPIDEDAVSEAVVAMAAAQLIQAGCSIESVERQFVERDYSIRLNYDFSTQELDVGVDWADEAEPEPRDDLSGTYALDDMDDLS